MAHKQTVDRKETLIGHTNTGRVIWPTIRGSIRRNDPDGMVAFPYYPSLTGTSLTIVLAGDFTNVLVANFISDSYGAAILVINALSPANLKAEDDNGYLRITNLNPGKKNLIAITGGTAAPIFGFEVDPIPGSTSYAGELPTTAIGWPQQTNDQLSRLVSSNESLNSIGINRAIASVANMFDSIVGNMDREFALPRKIDVTVTGGVFTLPGGEDLTRIFIGNTNVANPSLDVLDKIVSFVDSNDDQVFVNNTRVRVQSMTYGALVDATTSFASWTASDGKSIFGNLVHWSKTKTTGTISKIKGNVLTLTGGSLLVTRRVLPGDTLIISGATNHTPFNHNGEFIVEAVHSENHVSVRPKGLNDQIYDSLNDPPASLNTNKQGGEVFGTITVVVGKAIPSSMPAARVNFNLNVSPPNGTYRVILSVARTLRSLLPEDINLATVYKEFGKQIELGSKLQSADNAHQPRIISAISDNSLNTLLAEFPVNNVGGFPVRIYLGQTGSFNVLVNSKFDNVNGYTKSVAGTSAMKITVNEDEFTIQSRKAADDMPWNSWDDIARFPVFEGTISSHNLISNGVTLGVGLNTAAAQALVPRIRNTFTTAGAPRFTLINETINSGTSASRVYIEGSGNYTLTLNAAWNGTNWVKDSAIPSFKTVFSKSGTVEYRHSSATTPFADSAWTAKDWLKNLLFDEDFLQGYTAATIASGDSATSLMKVAVTTRTKFAVLGSNGDYQFGNGTIVATTNTQTFAGELHGKLAYPIKTRDFLLKVKARSAFRPQLDIITSTDTPGAFVGIREDNTAAGGTPPPFWIKQFGLVAGNDQNNWFVRVGSGMEVDSGQLVGDMTEATFERVNGVLTVHINGVLLTTVNNTDDIGYGVPVALAYGTASADNQEVLYTDYIKLWLPRPF